MFPKKLEWVLNRFKRCNKKVLITAVDASRLNRMLIFLPTNPLKFAFDKKLSIGTTKLTIGKPKDWTKLCSKLGKSPPSTSSSSCWSDRHRGSNDLWWSKCWTSFLVLVRDWKNVIKQNVLKKYFAVTLSRTLPNNRFSDRRCCRRRQLEIAYCRNFLTLGKRMFVLVLKFQKRVSR